MVYQDPKIASDSFRYTPRSVVLMTLFFCGGSLLCALLLYIPLDGVCVRNANDWIPVYPSGTVVTETHTFLRPFGVGITTMRLSTTDTPNQVRKWYIDMRSRNEPNPTNLLATMNYSVQDGENGGTTIVLASECAWN